MQADTQLSVDFLNKFRPNGPWVLTRIRSDRTGIDTMLFDQEDELQRWLVKHNQSEKENIYFQVNMHVDGLQFGAIKKLKRDHIKSLDYLHVDIDPQSGKSIELEQQRILAVLKNPAGGLPDPTFLIFSGGGYQAFWRLKDPFMINGDNNLYEEAKLWNLQIEQTLEGADSCHNVDRIMRLPGTINWPTQRKEAQGRKPVLSKLVEYSDASYALKEFTKATPVQTGDSNLVGDSVKISGNVSRLGNINELGPDVKDTVKALIVQGANAETNTGTQYESESEAVWFVVCELVRQGIDDDIIYSVMTDPDFGISAHILKQPRVEKYAIRQIERAHEYAEDPKLMHLNEQYALIKNMDGGKCRVLSKVFDEATGRSTYSFQTMGDFKNALVKEKIPVGKKDMPAATWWLEHPKGRQYEGIVFLPGSESPTGYLNMWEGFAYVAQQGNWQLLREHIWENICNREKELFEYLMGWLASGVQHPGEQGHSAVVMRGKEGVGKSFLAKMYGALFGCHYMPVSSAKHVVGQFTGHLRNVVFLFGDEAFHVGDKQHESTLKALITEDLTMHEKKGVDAKSSRNCLKLMLASNESWVVPAGLNDRRFLVLDVGSGSMQNSEYFDRIAKQLDAGGYSAFLYDLLNFDLTNFNVRKIPSTQALGEQKLYNMKPTEQWFYDCLCQGNILHDRKWSDFHPLDSLGYEVRSNVTAVDPRSIGRLFVKLGVATKTNKRGVVVRDRITGREYQKQYVTGYNFESINFCREAWQKEMGFAVQVEEGKFIGGEAEEETHADF